MKMNEYACMITIESFLLLSTQKHKKEMGWFLPLSRNPKMGFGEEWVLQPRVGEDEEDEEDNSKLYLHLDNC